MTDETPFHPDESVIAERRPTNCPFCGQEGAFDGQGRSVDKAKFSRSGSASTTTYRRIWYRVRCPECNGRFQMLGEAEEIEA